MRFRVALLILALLPAFAQNPMGRRAPGFSLPDMKLKQHDLQDYRGKVVLLDFMQTQCPNCQELTGRLEQVKAKLGDKVQIFSVVTAPETQSTVAAYVARFKSTSTFLFDCGQMSASYLQITPQNPSVHVPRLLIVDKSGYIRRDLQTIETMTVPDILNTVLELSK